MTLLVGLGQSFYLSRREVRGRQFLTLCVILNKCALQETEFHKPDPLSTELIAMQHRGKDMVSYSTYIIVVKFVKWGIMLGEMNEVRISSEEALVSFARIQHWG